MQERERKRVDPLDVVDDQHPWAKRSKRAMGRFEDTQRIQRARLFGATEHELLQPLPLLADPGKGTQHARGGGERHRFRQGFYRFRPDGSRLEFLRSTDNNSWGLGLSEEGLAFGSTPATRLREVAMQRDIGDASASRMVER